MLTHFFFQIEIINSHTELLPVYVLIGRLIQKFPGLSNKFLQHYGLYMYCCVMSDIVIQKIPITIKGCYGHDPMVVGFTTTHAIIAYHHQS